MKAIQLLLSIQECPLRQRFSLTHALFHWLIDAREHAIVCAKKISGGNEIEKSVDPFASYFLMPSVALESFVKKY